MTDDEKLKHAQEFVERMKTMTIEQVGALVDNDCGASLTLYMLNFAAQSMARNPTVGNVQSLMLMGYLLKADQDKTNIFQGTALA